jgi:hemolysin D
MALIVSICTFVAVALLWSWFGRIEIIAVAQGKIQPTGRVKVVQPFETGKVFGLHVENGSTVRAGDDLVDLDAGDAKAELLAAETDLATARAEIQRRQTAIEAVKAERWTSAPEVAWAADVPDPQRQRQARVLREDLHQLATSVADLDAQIAQKRIERDHLAETIHAQEELLTTLNERVQMRTELQKSASGSRASVIDSLEALQTQRTVLTTQKNQHDGTIASLEVLAREREKTIASFVDDNEQKLAEAQHQADDLEQRVSKTRLRLDRMHLTSPIDGTVLGLTITTAGQVVNAGEEVMRIVPANAALEIESYLPNRDVGFVKPGQTAVVKIESFPFTRYGTLEAVVVRVAHDAIPEPDAQQTEANGTQATKSALFAGAQRTQNLVYPVTLSLPKTTMIVDGRPVPLKPGMAVNIEVSTGNRRILEYFLSPLVEVGSSAFKER